MNKFLGLSNKLDSLDNPQGFLKTAVNVNIDNTNNVVRRKGYALTTAHTDITSSYTLRNKTDSYIIDNGTLYNVSSGLAVASGLTGEYIFDDFEGNVFAYGGLPLLIRGNDASDMGVPMAGHARLKAIKGNQPPGIYQVAYAYRDQYGREGGCAVTAIELKEPAGIQIEVVQKVGYSVTVYLSPVNGKYLYQFTNTFDDTVVWDGIQVNLVSPLDTNQIGAFDVPKNCSCIAYHESKVYLSEFISKENKSIIWFSKPFVYHWFDKHSDYLVIEGEVKALVSTDAGLVIATGNSIYYYTDGVMNKVAGYGVPDGVPYARSIYGEIYMFTNSGICSLNNFENKTQAIYEFPFCSRVHAAIIYQNGYELFINLLDENTPALNIFSE